MSKHHPLHRSSQIVNSASRQLSRRGFLQLLTATTLGGGFTLSSACSHKKLFNPDENIILGGGSYPNGEQQQNALIVINLIQKEKKLINTRFLPHGIVIDPQNKYRVFCFEKNGTQACEINLQTQTVSRYLQSGINQQFSGHAVFSKGGKLLYSIESDSNNRQGIIAIRDAKTFELIKQLPTLGLNPHDCQLLPGNIIVVSNTAADKTYFHQPSLVSINMDTEKLVQRIRLDSPELNAGHFHITENNDVVIASATVSADGSISQNEAGGVSIKTANDLLTTMKEPTAVIDRMQGEALAIAVNESHQVAAITHPDANLLTFWSLKSKSILKAIGIEEPRGIEQTLDNRDFIVSYGKVAAMAKVSVSDLNPQADSIVQPTHMSGEHIVNWSRSLREIMPANVYD